MNEKIKNVMFVGTGSDVGKSVINAAFCRIFLQDGYNPAPFKAQNMSLNSFATPDGLEIGRAQAVQAEACGIPCKVEMNPVLLKPTGDKNSQVVLNGKPFKNQSAQEYFLGNDRAGLFREAMKSFYKLAEEFNPVVSEGAGSISEINLWDKDITNMKVAVDSDSPTFLIADIDRGGVFGSVYGTIMLLPENERKLIKGILINKFRGDISLFESGKKQLEELTGIPVIGVIPYFRDIHIEQEDSVVVDYKTRTAKEGIVNVAVVLLKHMSNFTDFDVFERLENVHLFYTAVPDELKKADIIIIPGSKNTISDMQHLRNSSLAKAILGMHKNDTQVIGVCGGYQILGKEIRDPNHVESEIEMISGLGLLPVITELSPKKRTVQCKFKFLENEEVCSGYEIHMGITKCEDNKPVCIIEGNQPDGCFVNEKIWGTYIHGIFDNNVVLNHILKLAGEKLDTNIDHKSFKEEQYNKLADVVRKNVDMELIYDILKK